MCYIGEYGEFATDGSSPFEALFWVDAMSALQKFKGIDKRIAITHPCSFSISGLITREMARHAMRALHSRLLLPGRCS